MQTQDKIFLKLFDKLIKVAKYVKMQVTGVKSDSQKEFDLK